MRQSKASICKVDIESLKTWLKERLHHERFEHSLGALEMASNLAKNFNLEEEVQERVAIAALLHDCAKLMTPEELYCALETFQIEVSEEERESPQTLHPVVGAELVRREFDIQDPDILNAIRYHTTGRADMGIVETIVYIADKIEENTRNPLYTQKILNLIDYQDSRSLYTAMQYIMDSTISFLIEKGQIIHPRTVLARNALVKLHKQAKTPSMLC